MAMDYITEHLDQAIVLEDVTKASHFSPLHFHRIFHSLVGETVNDYVSREKMENATSTLICHSHWSVTEVAMMGGFSSTANF